MQRERELVATGDLLAEQYRADNNGHVDGAPKRREDRKYPIEPHHQECAGRKRKRQHGIDERDVPMTAWHAESAGSHHEQRDSRHPKPEQIWLNLRKFRPDDLTLED